MSKVVPIWDNSLPSPITVTVVGGGSSAHSLIPLLSLSGHKVNILTRRPQSWSKKVTAELHSMNEEVLDVFEGSLYAISESPEEVIPQADAIILCMPVHQYRQALHRIAPFIAKRYEKKEVFIGTIYGQAGFNWMVHEIEREFDIKNLTAFAVGLIPWICRTLKYGSVGVNYGCKEVNVVAVTPHNRFKRLDKLLLNDMCFRWFKKGRFVQACSFLSLTLSVDNQIIHPARCYGIWKQYHGKAAKFGDGIGDWDKPNDVPYFYRDFDDISTMILKDLDEDYSMIRKAVKEHFPSRPFKYMLDYLCLQRLTHCNNETDIKQSFRESKQLGLIKTPTLQLPSGEHILNTECRFFTDDIPYGLLVAKWIAEKLGVATPHIDEVIEWAQTLMGMAFITCDGKINISECLAQKFLTGIPTAYGIESVDDILD